jgi:hypothetical protein
MVSITFITDSLSSFKFRDYSILKDLNFNVNVVEA